MFRHKAQHADNGYSPGKCCNTVTGHLVITLQVSFSVPLAVLNRMTIAYKICLASNTETLTVPVYQVEEVLDVLLQDKIR